MSEVPLPCREYSPRKLTVRSMLPPSFHQCSVLRVFIKLPEAIQDVKKSKQGCEVTRDQTQDLSYRRPHTHLCNPLYSFSNLQSGPVEQAVSYPLKQTLATIILFSSDHENGA